MKRKKGGQGWMAIKIDLERANHCLDWSFIRDTLLGIGCPSNFVDIIWHCILLVSLCVLCNCGIGKFLMNFTLNVVLDKEIIFLPICLCCAFKDYFI